MGLDPDPAETTYLVDYSFLLRARDGTVTVIHDRHVEGLFSRLEWLRWLEQAGLAAHGSPDQFGPEVFIGTRRFDS